MGKIFLYIDLFLILAFCPTELISQNSLTVLQKLQIKGNNIGFIYLSAIPKDFHSELSKSKTKIFINIFDASLNNSIREVHSTELLQDIFTKQIGDTIKIVVVAKNKTGYTIVPLPYSKSLMIELFDWDKLNKSEDNYRKALLAIEDGIITPAKKSLTLATNLGNPNAAANLALLQLYNGKVKSAFMNLLFANKLHTNIPDAYAGLSQIYKMYNMNNKAKYFSDIFTKMTGLKSFPKIIIGEIPVSDSLNTETIKLLEKINQPISKKENVRDDTLNQKFKNLLNPIGKKSVKQNTSWQIIKSFFPDWFFSYILVVLALIFLAIAILWFSYIKWKKNQMGKTDKTIIINRNKFNEDLELANNTNAMKTHASNLYKKNQMKTNEKAKTNITNEKKSDKTVSNNLETESKEPPKNLKSINNQNDFENKIDKIAQQLIAAQKKQNLEEYEDDFEKESNKKKEFLDASTKFAKQLQSKKQELKLGQIENLSDELPEEQDEITDLAKKLNMEKRSLKTKKNLKDLEKDKKSLENIKKKFDNNIENKND